MQPGGDGVWCNPINTVTDHKGSVYDDAKATDCRFKRGTIAFSIHLERFAPRCLKAFGAK
jgi:hypothetical protein